jgi:glycosyltransferase involved in cell wall biosynthesis
MRIAFVTIYDAKDIGNWSGTAYYMSKAFIDAGVEIEYVGGLKEISGENLIFRLRNFFYTRILKNKHGDYKSQYEPQNLKFIAGQVQKRLKELEVDIVFSPGAIPIAYLDTKIPIVLWSDATFAVMKDYYTCFTGLNKRTIKNCHSYEKKVLRNASLAIFSSEWAANSSIKDYGADQAKVQVIPYGANIECNRSENDIIEINRKKSREICKLLFIGQEWERKGGETAVRIAIELNNQNIKTELTIVGCTPPDNLFLPDYIHVMGFIKKSEKDGERIINRLYSDNHFFILPTIAECTPIVFSEANSFGLPVITTSTGGISSIIKNEINGRMFELEIDVPLCAAYIGGIFKNFDQYNRFSLLSFKEYMTKLNWNSSISTCIACLKKLL